MKHIRLFENLITPKFFEGDWVRFNNSTRAGAKKDLTIVYQIEKSFADSHVSPEQYRYWMTNVKTNQSYDGWVLEGSLEKISDQERDAIKYNL